MRRLGRTEPWRRANGEIIPNSIAEVTYILLGGVDQWIMMRGEDLGNPPLVLLYGGPGLSETQLFRHYNAPLEKAFTVVYWDQRGSGKSFDGRISRSSMTLERFIADLDELVEAVRRRTGKGRVAVLGHSWGTVLGVLYAARYPEKVEAYVGVAQIGDWPAAESASYAFALAEAKRLDDRKALADLRAIRPPPYDAKALWTERTALQRMEGRLTPKTLWDMGRISVAGPEASLLDLPYLLRGFRFSLDAMWAEVSQLNLRELVPALQMPVFFLLGRKDHWVPPETSVAYFEQLAAPSKQLVWFENSGHQVFADEPAEFNKTMVELVRPSIGPDAT